MRDERAPDERSGQVTALLSACSEGDTSAFDRLLPLVYDDLHRIAHKRLRSERGDHTLNTTAVVHEAYLQLVNQATATWRDRARSSPAGALPRCDVGWCERVGAPEEVGKNRIAPGPAAGVRERIASLEAAGG